jgi:hypothetical protein
MIKTMGILYEILGPKSFHFENQFDIDCTLIVKNDLLEN